VLPNPDIDPILIRLGPIALRWYGLMYVLGLAAAFFMIKARAAARNVVLSIEDLHDLILYAALGVILGGRLGYVLFYNLPYYLNHPAKLLAVWEGGMSFHGGLLGVIAAVGAFCWRKGYAFYSIADLAAPAVPIGLGLGRIGNFINGELYGRVTDVPWCMVFARTGGGPFCRHPSQLYEAALEGLLLFGLLACRTFVELFREPDAHLGLLGGVVSMGQLLSLPMLVLGVVMLWSVQRKQSVRS